MKIDIEIRENPRHIFYKITGTLTLEGFIEAATQVGAVSEENEIVHIFADYREVNFDINMASVFEMPDELELLGMPIDTRSAVLYPANSETDEKFEMFKMLARSKGHIVELFTDEQDALKWLSEK